MSAERRSELYVTNRTRRALQAIAESLDLTPDAIAEDWLTQRLEQQYPKLMTELDAAEVEWQVFVKQQRKKLKEAVQNEPTRIDSGT